MPEQNNQLSLLAFGGLDQNLGRVFQNRAIKSKDGSQVGSEIVLRGRKDLGKDFALKGDDLTLKVLEQQDAAMRLVKGEIAALNGDWTLKKASKRALASGITQLTVVVQEIKRAKAKSIEEIAAAYGETVEQAQARFARQVAKSKETIDVTSTPVPKPAGELPAPAPEADKPADITPPASNQESTEPAPESKPSETVVTA